MLLFLFIIVIQILLESVPVSSSGHLVLLTEGMRFFYDITPFAKDYLVALFPDSDLSVDVVSHLMHAPTVLLIAFFFRQRLMLLICNIWRVRFCAIKIVGFTFFADVATALFFLLFTYCKPTAFPLAAGFLGTMVMLLSLRWCPWQVRGINSWRLMVLLGCVQGLALLPGLSRFALSYGVARWLRLPHTKAFEVSFLIQWPLLFAAVTHAVVRLGMHGKLGTLLHLCSWPVMVTIAAATIGSYFLFILVERCARRNKLWYFGWYMIVPFALAFII